MKKKLLSIALIAITGFSFAQTGKTPWKSSQRKTNSSVIANKQGLTNMKLYELDVNELQQELITSPMRFSSKKSNTIVSFPNADGQMERYRIMESSNMDAELAARYPEIKSYVGQGIDNPSATIYLSLSPLGLQTMVLKADQSAEFIEPYTTDKSSYAVYKKSDKIASLNKFECKIIDQAKKDIVSSNTARPNADDGNLRNFRLAMSVTGEYTAYFGGTKALALAAINNTMTRVNGVFEKDFGAHMNLIANTDLVIYTSASTDPYSPAASLDNWNLELMNTLHSVLGDASFDVGHLFGATGGGGNAGCIGCVCSNDMTTEVVQGITSPVNYKGSGYTSPNDGIPMGDNFDIDYVAHELGHQFGANHTFTHSNEGTGVQMEPGSGSTIMGYAGITTLDVQPHSDPYFHAVSIQQVTNYIKTTTCQTTVVTGNAIPVVNAGLDYTIPKSTPFMLTGTATDANGDVLNYDWEQMNSQSTAAAPSATKTTGVNFRSYNPTASPTRYFPNMTRVLAGATTTAGSEITVEALSSVARTLNFRLTVRDNRAGGPANNSDDMVVTVNATAGPFSVSAPNTAVSYVGGSTQTVTWVVGGTTANGVNCANVDILISTNGGSTWSTLLAATPNDGTQAVTIPNTPGSTNRIMVKGTNHIFFDVSNTNFTITPGTTDTVAPTAPTLTASGTTSTTTNLSWSGATDNVAVTGYNVYQGATLLGSTTTATTYPVTGLTASTAYSFTVKAKDAAGNLSVASNTASVTTLAPPADTTAPTAPTVTASGTTQTTTSLSWSGATDNVAVTGYNVYQGATLLGSTTTATTYPVTGLTASTTYSFTIKAKDAAGNLSVASNTVSVTTLAAGGGATDLLFSEYVEGSSNNKALEIANNTGAAVNLAIYTVKKQTNGAGAWSTGITLSGTLNSGSKFVMVNSSIALTCYSTTTANISTAGTEMTFNGNDAVGLFKNGILIDIIGTFNGGTANFAIDTTLRRKATVTAPNATFNLASEWDSFAIDTCGGLGSKMSPSTKEVTNLDFTIAPNPVKGDILNLTDVSNGQFRIVNLMGQVVLAGKIETNEITVTSLNEGIYLLEITLNDQTVTKRFIKE